MDPEKEEKIARCFQTLKQVWDRWLAGDKDALPPDVESFFVGLTAKYFQQAMQATLQNQKGPLASLGGTPSPQESWQIMRAYFNLKRPRARHRILDSIFAEALARSGKSLSDAMTTCLRKEVIYLLGRYKRYCFTAVRDFYARERLGPTKLRWITDSGNAPVEGEGSTDTREVFDTLRPSEPSFSPAEEADLTAIAEKGSTDYFATLRDVQKAGLLALYARNCAGKKLRYNDPHIAEFVNVSESQFYEIRQTTVHYHIVQFRETEIWKGEDPESRVRLEELLVETLLEKSFQWFARKKPDHVSSLLGNV